MAHFSLIVQEWEWHLHPGWTTGCCQVVAYIITCKNKDGKGCKRTRAREKGLNYSAMSAHEAFRIWNGYNIKMKRTSLRSDSFSGRPSSSIISCQEYTPLSLLPDTPLSCLINTFKVIFGELPAIIYCHEFKVQLLAWCFHSQYTIQVTEAWERDRSSVFKVNNQQTQGCNIFWVNMVSLVAKL